MRSDRCLMFRDEKPDAVGKSGRIATSSSGRFSVENQLRVADGTRT